MLPPQHQEARHFSSLLHAGARADPSAASAKPISGHTDYSELEWGENGKSHRQAKTAWLPSTGTYPHPVGRHRAGLASAGLPLCPGWQPSCGDTQATRKSRGNMICHYKSRRAKIGCRADRRQQLCCSIPPWHVISPLCHLNTYLQEEQQRDGESTCLCNKTKMLS